MHLLKTIFYVCFGLFYTTTFVYATEQIEGIYISEVLPNPVGTDSQGEYIEIINTSNTPVLINELEVDNQNISILFAENLPEPIELLPNQVLIIYDKDADLSTKVESPDYLQGTVPSTGLRNSADKIELTYANEIIASLEYESSEEGVSIVHPILSCASATNSIEQSPGSLGGLGEYPDYLPQLEIESDEQWIDVDYSQIEEGVNFRFSNQPCGVLLELFEWSTDQSTWIELEEEQVLNVVPEPFLLYLKYLPTDEVFEFIPPEEINLKINELWTSSLTDPGCTELDNYYTFSWLELVGELPNGLDIYLEDDKNNIYSLEYLANYSTSNFHIYKLSTEVDSGAIQLFLKTENRVINEVELLLSEDTTSLGLEQDRLEYGYLPTPGTINTALNKNIRINEILANPSTGGEWLEIYNYGNTNTPLVFFTLSDLSSTQQLSCDILDSRSYKYISDDELSITLNNSGDDLTIKLISGTVVDNIGFPQLDKGTSWAFDGGGFRKTSLLTPEKTNNFSVSVVDNEEGEAGEEEKIDVGEDEEEDDEQDAEKKIASSLPSSQRRVLPYKVPQLYLDLEDTDNTTIKSPVYTPPNKYLPILNFALIFGGGLSLTQIKESREVLINLWEFIKSKFDG